MTKNKDEREWWIFKGSSCFGDKFNYEDDGTVVKNHGDGFYDLISPQDTIANSIHVVPKSRLDETLTEIADIKDQINRLDSEIDPRGGDHDPGFITQKGVDIYTSLWEQLNPIDPGEKSTYEQIREERDRLSLELNNALASAKIWEEVSKDLSRYHKLRDHDLVLSENIISQLRVERDQLRQGFQKLRDTIEFGPFFGIEATNAVQEADKILKETI